MRLKIEFGVLIFLSMLLFVDFAVGFRPQKPRNINQPAFFRRSNGPSRYISPRRVPYGPMFPPKVYGNQRTPANVISKPYKRSQFPSFSSIGFGPLLPSPSFDSGTRSMSLDDAFKMGYESGKAVAISDRIRNQGRPGCGQDGVGGSQCSSSGMTLYNFFFPSKPSNNNDYRPDGGFGSSGDEDEGYFDHSPTIDSGNDDYYATLFPYFGEDDSGFGTSDADSTFLNFLSGQSSESPSDNFVSPPSEVSVPSDDEPIATPVVVLDTSAGTVVVPVDTSASSDKGVSSVSSD